MSKLVTKEKIFIRVIKAPLRALAKARDFYVNNMIRCAGQYGDGCSHVGSYSLPRSTSSASSRNADEDLRELIRASSTKMLSMKGIVVSEGVVYRSQSVGIVRIDEDKACEFDEAFVAVKVPRSRSYAVPRRTMI